MNACDRRRQKGDLVATALANADLVAGTLASCLTPEHLGSVSDVTLQTLMLSRLNLAANLQRDIADLVQSLAEQLAEAKLAEMLLQARDKRGKR